MKTLNLFKPLIFSKKLSHQNFNSNGGFTIIEVLIVVLIIGILSAIAAPGWNAFISRQRTRTVNDGVFRALRSAQNNAKFNKEDVTVTFDPATDPPVISITNKPNETLNANGEIKAGMVELVSGVCTDETCAIVNTDSDITFNYLGEVSANDVPFIVTVSTPDDGLRRCVIIQTLLGGMRTDEGNYDASTGRGCNIP